MSAAIAILEADATDEELERVLAVRSINEKAWAMLEQAEHDQKAKVEAEPEPEPATITDTSSALAKRSRALSKFKAISRFSMLKAKPVTCFVCRGEGTVSQWQASYSAPEEEDNHPCEVCWGDSKFGCVNTLL